MSFMRGQMTPSMRAARRSRRASTRASNESLRDLSQAQENCLFCLQHNGYQNLVVLENATFFVRYDNFPASQGHVEVVPKRHVESFFELTEQEIAHAYALILLAKEKINIEHKPDGYTIGVNEGRAAGRSVDHLHIHLIPRYKGDVEDPRGGIRRIMPNCEPDIWANC